MNTIILLYFPSEYSYAVSRTARYITPPLEVYADVKLPDVTDIPAIGDDGARLVFDSVFIPEEAQIYQLSAGNCYAVYQNKDVFTITEARVKNRDKGDNNLLRLTGRYSMPYASEEFRALTIQQPEGELNG